MALQSPKGYAELDLRPGRDDSWGSDERSITRQAVRGHLRELKELGVVQDAPEDASGQSKFVVNHAKLFGVVEQLRELATVRAMVELEDHTVELEARAGPAEVAGPHFVLVRGVQEGRAFALSGAAPPEGWVIGRQRAAAVALDYNPYISSTHARVLSKDGAFFLVDLPDNRNGTYLNWRKMVRGGVAPLKAGDVVGVGMSLLVFRE